MNERSQLFERVLRFGLERIRGVRGTRANQLQVGDSHLDALHLVLALDQLASGLNGSVETDIGEKTLKTLPIGAFKVLEQKNELQVTTIGAVVEVKKLDLLLVPDRLDPTDHADMFIARLGVQQASDTSGC